MTKGSDDLSVNINHKLFECVFSSLKLQKDFHSNPPCIIVFVCVLPTSVKLKKKFLLFIVCVMSCLVYIVLSFQYL